jgi:ATP synthase F1 complex assembly factor 1
LDRQGLKDINELKEAYKDKIQELKKTAAVEIPSTSGTPPPAPQALSERASTSPFPPPPPPPQVPSATKGTPGVKTLSNFIDIAKTRELPQKEIEVIWRLRHASNPQSLCAVVPLDAYKKIEASAKKYPHFILPVPREGQGAEIHLLQWTFPAADTVTVLFTHLAEFKLRGEYAQPHTTITHHLELAQEKGLVLLQGQVVEGRGISVDEAKWLLMCLQKFYGFGSENAERKKLLELFGKGDPAFSVEDLVAEAEKAI